MKTDSVRVFHIMLNGFTFSRHRMVVHQGNVSYTLPGTVYLAGKGGAGGKNVKGTEI